MNLSDYCELAKRADELGLYALADAITHQLSLRTASTDITQRLAQVTDSPFYILGISPNATFEEAEEAYYKLIDELGKRKREKTRVEDFLIQRANEALSRLSRSQPSYDEYGDQIEGQSAIEKERQFFHPEFPESKLKRPEPQQEEKIPWWKQLFRR